jgi:hypothetical protein
MVTACPYRCVVRLGQSFVYAADVTRLIGSMRAEQHSDAKPKREADDTLPTACKHRTL